MIQAERYDEMTAEVRMIDEERATAEKERQREEKKTRDRHSLSRSLSRPCSSKKRTDSFSLPSTSVLCFSLFALFLL